MRQACQIDVLGRMIELRRPRFARDGADKAEGAEEIILEIAELAYLLQADGFPVPEVFKRIGSVLDPPPSGFASMHKKMGEWSDPLRTYTRFYLKHHRPAYLDPANGQIFNTAFAIAELWAEINAERRNNSCWPPEDMLGKGSEDAGKTLNALLQQAGGCARDYRRLKARAVPGDMIRNYSTGKLSFAAMMGSAGIALIRDGRSIDYVETIMN
jgi:hypothetical protein